MRDSNDRLNPSAPEPASTLGLIANGSAGPWTVEVDETASGEQRWLVQIEGPACDFSFDFSSAMTAPLRPKPHAIAEEIGLINLSRPKSDRNVGRIVTLHRGNFQRMPPGVQGSSRSIP